jgi:hypothetical protein
MKKVKNMNIVDGLPIEVQYGAFKALKEEIR